MPTRSASGSSAGSRPSRAGRPTGPRAPRPPCPSTSTKKRRLSSGSGVSSSAWLMCAISWRVRLRHARPRRRLAQPVEVVGERARLELGALHALLLGPRARRLEHLVDARPRDHGRAVGVEDDDVARADRRSRRPRPARRSSPRLRLRRAADAHPARPDRQAELAQLLDVAHRRRRRGAPRRRAPSPAWRAARRRARPARGSGIVSTRTSPGSIAAITACTIRLSSCPQRTVRAGPAAREPGTTW